MSEKVALITGITGQDGAYLTDLLLKKDYEVIGCYRRTASSDFWRINHLGISDHPKLKLVSNDLLDFGSCFRLISEHEPTEVYNLAAQSFVGASFEQPTVTTNVNCIGPLNLLESIRIVNKGIKFYQASTSEMFGKVQEVPQKISTPFYPRSVYGVSKLYSHWLTINYQESYNMHASSGILFNHESELRGLEFVTRKITHSLSMIKKNQVKDFKLGNLNAKRDWGYAPEYVEGIWKMLQHDNPETFILSTGVSYTVRDFVNYACEALEFKTEWQGDGLNEKLVNLDNGSIIISIDEKFFRPTEVDALIGDNSKAKDILKWEPKVTVKDIVDKMVRADMDKIK